MRPSEALAHNPDTSYARIRIAADKLELRFTCDLVTLLKIAKLDERGSGTVTRADLKKHAPEIFDFLRRHVALEINGRESDLGSAGAFGWAADVGDVVPEKDYHSAAALIHFHFTRPLDDLPEDVAIEFDFFAAFGERHTVQGVFEFKDDKHEVNFTRFEPDYLFDTGYRAPWFKRHAKWLRFLGALALAGAALWLSNRRRWLAK